MTTEELAELFLAHLYELAEEAPHPNFLFSVNDFAPKLGITDKGELQKAIEYLENKGFVILASFDMYGGISAGITAEGSIFVESGGETGMIKKYRKPPKTPIRTPSQPSPLPIDRGRTGPANVAERDSFFARPAVEAILEDIEDAIQRDDALAGEARKDLLSDLATLKIQMERNVTNMQIVNSVLSNLSTVPSVAPLVTGLKCIFETYFI
jgi:hypothetical protein